MISALIIVYLIRVGIALFDIIRAPLPHPADCILLSIFFYNAPLALIAIYGLEWLFPQYMVFLNPESHDPYLAQMTMICCFVATLGLDIGRKFFVRAKFSQTYIRADKKMLSASVISLLGLCFIVLLTASLMGFSNYFAGYGDASFAQDQSGYIALLYFCFEAAGMFILLVFASRNAGNRRLIITILVLCVLFLSLMVLVRGKRLELVVALMPMLLLLWSVKLRSITSRLIAAGTFIMSFSALASLRFGEIPTLSSLAFNSMSEGLYAGHVTPGIINAIQSQGMPMEFGTRIYAGLLAMIPRFVFPQKDELVYQSVTDISEFAPLGATSFLGEAYLQGGFWFIFACFFTLGMISRALVVEKLYNSESGYIPLKSLYYLIFLGTFLFHFRDGMMVMIKLTIQMVILVMSFKLVLVHQRFNAPLRA